MSHPNTEAVPLVGRRIVLRILVRVVLPAPFGPSRPNSSPAPTSSDTSLSAVISFFCRFTTPVVVVKMRLRLRTEIAVTKLAPPPALLDCHQLHVEDQRGVGRNAALPARAVAEIRRG